MNTSKQFWALVRFHTLVSPFVWAMPLAFCVPLFMMVQSYPSLNLLIQVQNLFLVAVLGALVVAPEIFSGGAAAANGYGLGIEFIRTRAVDKAVLARSRAACFFATALVAPLLIAAYALVHPDVQVSIYPSSVLRDCLRYVSGSTLVANGTRRTDLVSIPSGNVLIAAWHIWEFLVVACLVQALVYLLYPLKHRRSIFWISIAVVSLSPLLGLFGHYDTVPLYEALFFRFASHQALFWSGALVALIAGQAWSEWRFARLEQ